MEKMATCNVDERQEVCIKIMAYTSSLKQAFKIIDVSSLR